MMSRVFLPIVALSVVMGGIAAVPSTAAAQRLVDLQQGARIRVETRSYGNFIGALKSATADSVSIRDNTQTLAFSLANARSVSTSPGPSAARGMLRSGAMAGMIGTVIGAGVGAMTYKPCNPDGAFDCAVLPNSRSRATTFGAISFGVSSLLIGSIVGAIRGSDSWTPVAIH